MSARLLRRREVLARIGIKTSALYGWMDPSSPSYNPTFPKPVVLSRDKHGKPSCVAWREADIEAWLDSLESTRYPCEVAA